MVKSGQNYEEGIKAFLNKDYKEASINLTKVLERDPHYEESQKALKQIVEEAKTIVIEQNKKSTTTPVSIAPSYSEIECENQIKEIISQVDQAYLDWWNQFEEARKPLANCYSNESALICSRKHSDLNVEWQNKITETINGYKKGLSKCNPSNVQFSKYSNIISTSY